MAEAVMKKLYEVKIIHYGVVLADSAAEATDSRREILAQELPEVNAYPLHKHLPPGWTEDTLVYHPGDRDLTLAQAREEVIRPEQVANTNVRRW
jgi:hypothetical protein